MPKSFHRGAGKPAFRSRYKTDRDKPFRLPHVERVISSCPDRYFITLTSRRELDPLTMSAEVGRTMQRVNTKLFGTAYRRDGMQLATLAVQERSYNECLHTHMIVGVPEGSLSLKANPCPLPVPDLITNTWISMDPQARFAEGQDARDVDDFDGVRRYIYKGIRVFKAVDNLDLNNTRLPR